MEGRQREQGVEKVYLREGERDDACTPYVGAGHV